MNRAVYTHSANYPETNSGNSVIYLFFLLLLILLLSSCTGFRPFDSEEAIKIKITRPDQVVMGIDDWENPSDCSARAFLNKTASGLLFTVEVIDDSVKTGASRSFLNDGVELYFDFRPPRLRVNNNYEKGVFQAIILPEPDKKQVAPIEWFPKNYKVDIPGTRAYTELRDSGYVVQVSIPYSSLKRNHFWPRESFYMDVAINDADTGSRESQIMWAGKRDNFYNPHNFKKVSFEDSENREPEKPNILLFLTDQLTIDAIGAYGNPYLQTPFMDALARHGIRFTKSYAASTDCSPSRISILTGRMPHETGVCHNWQTPDPSVVNIGQILQKEGYYTFWGGKWNLPEPFPQRDTLKVPGFKLIDFLNEKIISTRGNNIDSDLTNAVNKLIKGRIKQPFLLAVSFENPHDITGFPLKPDIFSPPPNINSAPPLPANFKKDPMEPELLKFFRTDEISGISKTSNFTPEIWRNYIFHYYRLIEKMDYEIGKIISALEDEGMDQNTLIILTSAHGDGAASHELAGNVALYEEAVNVPLFLTWFGKTPYNYTDNEHLVSGIDITPTIIDYAGGEISTNFRGKSLKALIENPDTTWRDYLVTELAVHPQDSTKIGRMITDGRYKYIVYSQGKRNEQLFDLANDPGEEKNIVNIRALSGKKMELRTELKKWIKESGDHFKF